MIGHHHQVPGAVEPDVPPPGGQGLLAFAKADSKDLTESGTGCTGVQGAGGVRIAERWPGRKRAARVSS